MKKILFTLFAILLYQVLPLAGAPTLLFHWKILTIIVLAAALWLSQPGVDTQEARAYHASDRNTMWLILLMAGVATVCPEVEWAYFNNDHSGNWIFTLAGISFMTTGAALRVWAIQVLGKHFTGTVQTHVSQQLITSGPYRLVRHPSYLGAFVSIIGCAILLQAWTGLVIAVLAMGYAYFQRIGVEEAALSARFGDPYLFYIKNTWKMVPGIW